jgi:hypothetical protein
MLEQIVFIYLIEQIKVNKKTHLATWCVHIDQLGFHGIRLLKNETSQLSAS